MSHTDTHTKQPHSADNQQKQDKNDQLYLLGRWSRMSSFAERGFDLIASLFCLIVFSPLMLFCYIAVKREDGGPAIYRQERIGKGGRPFFIYKFRSMKINAEEGTPQLCIKEDENRLTHIGRFLRDHHLDELPQLWNVFIGDMAFVGPRPERKYFIDQIMAVDPRYKYLYQVRPGVTSYATLHNGYATTLEEMLTRLESDLYHLQHHSLLFNLKILFKTFISIISGKKF